MNIKHAVLAVCCSLVLAAPAWTEPQDRQGRDAFQSAGSQGANRMAPVAGDTNNLIKNDLSRIRFGGPIPAHLQNVGTGGSHRKVENASSGNKLQAPAQIKGFSGSPKRTRVQNFVDSERAKRMQ
ncbi:MAG: hypothetical protein AB1758_10720 [Candidatus Eremiobacterota bacterium]